MLAVFRSILLIDRKRTFLSHHWQSDLLKNNFRNNVFDSVYARKNELIIYKVQRIDEK